jgi:hypothetical protein
VAIVIVSLFALGGLSEDLESKEELHAAVAFNCKRLTTDLPSSVVFDFDVRDINSDSIYIQ